MTITDAGSLVALVDSEQAHHKHCRRIFDTLTLPLLTTWPALTEAMYLLGRIGGWSQQNRLWAYIERGTLVIHPSTTDEQIRMRVLMEQYRDRPMDLADASPVAAAEARGDRRIFTIDSDFYFHLLNGREPFEVVP